MELAHQGGWDEALTVLAPIGVVVMVIGAFVRRSTHPEPDGSGDGDPASGSADAGSS